MYIINIYSLHYQTCEVLVGKQVAFGNDGKLQSWFYYKIGLAYTWREIISKSIGLAYSWKGIYVSVLHEVFIKTRRENADLPYAKR